MSREAIAQALDKAAEALAEAAHAMRATEPDRSGSVAAAVPSGEPVAAAGGPPPPARRPSESAFTECPAHQRPWTAGKFGDYCTATSDDPDWSNDKGYCRVTPRSAGAWLRQHPRAA